VGRALGVSLFETLNPKKEHAPYYWRMLLFALIGSMIVWGFMYSVALGAGPNHY
jgi:hypothetical protein